MLFSRRTDNFTLHLQEWAAASVERVLKRASVAVECALVLPVFFLAMVVLISPMEAIRIRSMKEMSLIGRAKEMAVAAAVASGAAGTGGTAADSNAAFVDLQTPFTFSWPVSLFGLSGMRVAVRARVGIWSGGGIPTDGADAESDEGYVYVTNNRSVYHTHADCSHLDLTIFSVSMSEIGSMRNADGRRYKKCRGFPSGYTGPVYATGRGDYYYPDTARAALTRHVRMVKQSEVQGLHECSRCAARDAA